MFSIFILLLFINDKQHLLIDVIDFLISGLVLLRHCSRIAKDVGSNPSNMPVIFFSQNLGKYWVLTHTSVRVKPKLIHDLFVYPLLNSKLVR